jgi:hypothetical protein
MAQLRILRLQDERQGAGLLPAGVRHRSPKLESAGPLSEPQYVNTEAAGGACAVRTIACNCRDI